MIDATPGDTTIELNVTGVVPPEALLGICPLPPPHALSSIREMKIRLNDNDEVFTLVSSGSNLPFFR
jgi:hypothetical protein